MNMQRVECVHNKRRNFSHEQSQDLGYDIMGWTNKRQIMGTTCTKIGDELNILYINEGVTLDRVCMYELAWNSKVKFFEMGVWGGCMRSVCVNI